MEQTRKKPAPPKRGRRKADPVMVEINGLTKTYGLGIHELMKAFDRGETATRAKMKRNGGDWTIKDICVIARAAGVEPLAILEHVTATSY